MRQRRHQRLWIAAMVVAGAFVSMPRATASSDLSPTGSEPTRAHARAGTARTCYAQSDRDGANYVVSQNFEPNADAYDAEAADDFVLTKTCRRPLISIDSTYCEGTGVADSFNVTIYRAKAHGPGKVVRFLAGMSYTDTCRDLGCIELELGKKLRAGHWWISVQANLSFTETGSEWFWLTNQTVRGTGAMWQNPADGFQTGCTTYTDLITCLGDIGVGGDLSFSIITGPRGVDRGLMR